MFDYDSSRRLVRVGAYATGYHTRLAAGTPVHAVRESMYYAQELLESEDQAQWSTAHEIIAAVLELQDTDPTHATYGIWSWFAEEPLSAMAPPDWNWADFIGAPLVELLITKPERLPPKLTADMKTAVGHAAWSIFRRNVGPGYTNIALMGAAVALAAGELLGEPRLIDYAVARLRACADYYTWVGGLTEYNSPTYTIIALEEVERAMRLGRHPLAAAEAARLHQIVWETIAEHWHASTGQWAGPHARCYYDFVTPENTALIALKTGAPLPPGLADAKAPAWARMGPPCPLALRERFTRVTPAAIRRRFARDANHPARDQWGTTWMDADACLGSISRDTTWTQRRPVVAYWRTETAQAACLRVRLLKDGKDFASGQVWTTQDGPRVLIGLILVTDQGDWHCSLDRPARGSFSGSMLELRVEVNGPGSAVQSDGANFLLQAGGRHIRVSPGPIVVDGKSATWSGAQDEQAQMAWVGVRLPVTWPLVPANLSSFTASLGIELAVAGPASLPQATAAETGWQEAHWQGLAVRWPARPGPA